MPALRAVAARVIFAFALAGFGVVGPAEAAELPTREEIAARPAAPGERALEVRLLAPCCYTQTLDMHESPLASDLRLEIRARLYAGETSEIIERSFVERYSERVRAAPSHDPTPFAAIALLVVAGAAGLMTLALLRRWRARAAPETPVTPSASRDDDDDRIDQEVADLDG